MNHKNQNLTNETRTGLAQAKNLKYSLRDYYFLLILNILQLNLLLSTAIKDCISESMLMANVLVQVLISLRQQSSGSSEHLRFGELVSTQIAGSHPQTF